MRKKLEPLPGNSYSHEDMQLPRQFETFSRYIVVLIVIQ